MANTYTLIASNTLSSSAASVTFSAIPNTYTDLVLKVSARRAASGRSDFDTYFNGDNANNSYTFIQGSGSAASSNRGGTIIRTPNVLTGETETADSFNSVEIYIPNYNSTALKPVSIFGAHEVNATAAYIVANAGLWTYTPATGITSVTMKPASGDFKPGSSFFLYGIKNS